VSFAEKLTLVGCHRLGPVKSKPTAFESRQTSVHTPDMAAAFVLLER